LVFENVPCLMKSINLIEQGGESCRIRLYGTVGEVREATENEIKSWHRRVRRVRSSKGYSIMWENMKMVRDITFSRVEPVHMGQMTHEVWETMSNAEKPIA